MRKRITIHSSAGTPLASPLKPNSVPGLAGRVFGFIALIVAMIWLTAGWADGQVPEKQQAPVQDAKAPLPARPGPVPAEAKQAMPAKAILLPVAPPVPAPGPGIQAVPAVQVFVPAFGNQAMPVQVFAPALGNQAMPAVQMFAVPVAPVAPPPPMAVQGKMAVPARPAAPAIRLNQAVAPLFGRNENVIQQLEAQFGPQMKMIFRSEMHFMRVTCQPTKAQYEKISGDDEARLKQLTREYVLAVYMPKQVNDGPIPESRDPHASIANEIGKRVQENLSPEQASRYQKELAQRAVAKKSTALLNLVAKADEMLMLSTEQRDKLGNILEHHWHESMNQTEFYVSGNQFLPRMPEQEVLAILTDPQKEVWKRIPKAANFRTSFGMGQGMELDDEVWDEDQAPKRPQMAPEKSATKSLKVAPKETKK